MTGRGEAARVDLGNVESGQNCEHGSKAPNTELIDAKMLSNAAQTLPLTEILNGSIW